MPTIGAQSIARDIMRKYLLAFFGLALVLSACRIESNIILDINEDGSATVGAEVGFDEEMLDLVSQNGGDPNEILGDLPDLGGEDVQPIQRVEGDMTYIGAQSTVADLSTYDFDGLQGETFSEFSYEFDDATATLSAQVDASGIGDLGGEDLPIDPTEITGDIFAAHVVVTMPGTVTEHNADEVRSGGTLVWDLPLSGTKDIFAASNLGGSATNWIWFIVGGVLIIGIIAAIAAITMSNKESQKAVAAAAAEHDARTSEITEHEFDSDQDSANESPSAEDQPSDPDEIADED